MKRIESSDVFESPAIFADRPPAVRAKAASPEEQQIQQEIDAIVEGDLRSAGIPDRIIKDILPYTHKKHSRIHYTPGADGYVSTVTVFLDDPTGATPPSQQYMVDVSFEARHGDRAAKYWKNTLGTQELDIDTLTRALLDDVGTRAE